MLCETQITLIAVCLRKPERWRSRGRLASLAMHTPAAAR
jgi:hypothetical protein